MKPGTRFLTAGLLLAGSLGAHAQTPDYGLRMDSGFYISAGVGKGRTNVECTGGGPCDALDTSWNVSAGYQFNRNFGAEIGYADLGKSTSTVLTTGGPVTAVTEAKAYELVGVGILPLTDKWAFYVKAGLFRSEAKSSSPGLGAGIGSGKENDTGFTYAGGVQWSVTPNFGLRFEWQNYNDVGTGVVTFPAADYTVWRTSARYKF